MILIEVNNRNATSNFELLKATEESARQNVKGDFCIVLNPHLEGDIRITRHDHGETNNAPHGTNSDINIFDSDNTIWSS